MDSLDMRIFAERCSICFDNRLDFCLEHCQDQFCKTCWNRYVEELVRASWGLSTPKIKCPVCNDHLEKKEWSLYVRDDVVALYDKNSRPFKSLARCCPCCSSEVPVVQPANDTIEKRENAFDQAYNHLRLLNADQTFLDEFQTMYRRHLHVDGHTIALSQIYSRVIDYLQTLSKPCRPNHVAVVPKRRRIHPPTPTSPSPPPLIPKNPHQHHLIPSLISSCLISTAQSSHDFTSLQFQHIRLFSDTICESCGSGFCMTCGEVGWGHAGACLEVMKKVVGKYAKRQAIRLKKSMTKLKDSGIEKEDDGKTASSVDSLDDEEESIANLKWKVENSKNCPRCFTLIQRDDGCNKVDCAMCGHKFCWICQGDWSEKCGFYRCRVEPVTPVSPEQENVAASQDTDKVMESRRTSTVEDKPELGVPDVIVIQTRISRQQSVA